MLHIEIRKKIVEARENGLKIAEISKAYDTSESSVNRLLRQARETGSIDPQTHKRGRKPTLDADGLERLRALILSRPDITLIEIKEEMDLPIGVSAISMIITGKLGFRYKKRQYMPVSGIELM
jgi:transposase